MQQLDVYDLFTGAEEQNTELVPASDPRSEFLSIDPTRLWGTACIRGTRVPIKSLFDHLASGVSLDEFLDDFEGVPREKCVEAIAMAFEQLMDGLPEGRPER
ncbi:MAG: hypothetical protein JWN14_1935 [Chthonomonadales bacterium]|nr:hypothetical protein [Chthonomonadales bacterium]